MTIKKIIMKKQVSWDSFFKFICGLAAIIFIVAIIIKLARPSLLVEIKLETLLLLLGAIIILPFISQFEAFGVKVEVKKRLDDLSATVKALPDYVLGSEFLSEEDYILAEESYRKCLTYSSDFWPAILGLGVIYQDQKAYDKAIMEYNKVLNIEPKVVYALNNLAEVYIEAPSPIKDPQKAYDLADQALKIIPSLGSALYYKCEALNRLGRYTQAHDILRGMIVRNTLPSQRHWVMYELLIANSNQGKNISEEELDKIFFQAKDNSEGEFFLEDLSKEEQQERFKPSDRSILKQFLEKNKSYIMDVPE
jgi:tetratricopeptide (TPR) repeat protein